tara:strand:+ start:784 stop:1299 length:516 start_codon:yes stop_codon:yes gene_type:complete
MIKKILQNFKNALISLYNYIFNKKVGIVVETEADHLIDLELANENDSTMSDQVFIEINKYRTSNGMNAVKKGNQYSYAYAVRHTKYMIENKKINHDDFGLRSRGLKFRGAKRVGEIVAYGYSEAESVVYAWLHSPGHKAIIDGDYTHTGFGIMKDDRGTYYFTELFYHDNS